ncbi:hypothetical protein BD779DRAFT_1469495 [Infundibulicybe gibba]|nr:hypothetical protein BD779DRAFT_1469495 [Infundibulicybe gibba]
MAVGAVALRTQREVLPPMECTIMSPPIQNNSMCETRSGAISYHLQMLIYSPKQSQEGENTTYEYGCEALNIEKEVHSSQILSSKIEIPTIEPNLNPDCPSPELAASHVYSELLALFQILADKPIGYRRRYNFPFVILDALPFVQPERLMCSKSHPGPSTSTLTSQFVMLEAIFLPFISSLKQAWQLSESRCRRENST